MNKKMDMEPKIIKSILVPSNAREIDWDGRGHRGETRVMDDLYVVG